MLRLYTDCKYLPSIGSICGSGRGAFLLSSLFLSSSEPDSDSSPSDSSPLSDFSSFCDFSSAFGAGLLSFAFYRKELADL